MRNTAASGASLVCVDRLSMNQLYYGDNLEVLRQHIKDESIDLVYLDPPFLASGEMPGLSTWRVKR
jgi:16S rRNA G966 N2-methylase RsmD